MVYQGFNNRVAILLKKKLLLDLAERPAWWKPTVKSRVYPCKLRGFLSLVLRHSSFWNFGKFYIGFLCDSFTKKVAVLQSIDNLYYRSSFFTGCCQLMSWNYNTASSIQWRAEAWSSRGGEGGVVKPLAYRQ